MNHEMIAEEKRDTAVNQVISELASCIDALGNDTDRLRNRLSAVLSQNPSTSGVGRPDVAHPSIGSSSTVNILENLTAKVQDIHMIVEDIKARLEA